MSDRCSNLLDFQWHQYVSWRSFAYSNITICHCTPSKPMQTSFNQHGQLSSFDKDMLEHVELRVSQFQHSLQRLQNLPRTGQGMLFHGFQWFSMAFRMMALQFLLVRFGSSHIRFGSFYLGRCFWCNGVNIVVLTVGSFGSLWLATLRTWTSNGSAWCLW